jgi:hypothetical protein
MVSHWERWGFGRFVRHIMRHIRHDSAQAVAPGGARCVTQVIDRGSQADARGAAQVLGRGAQADARGAAQVLCRGAQAVAPAPLVARRRYLIVVPRPLPTAPLVVCRRYLIEVPRPLPAASLRCRSR